LSPRAWLRGLLLALAMWAIVFAAIFAVAGRCSVRDPIAIAQTAWRGSPCTNRIRVYWDHAVFTRQGFVGVASGVVSFAPFRLRSCDVALDPVYWGHTGYYARLAVILHEAGHLAGRDHTPEGLMSPDHHGCTPMCRYFPEWWTR
jgi:hypothetical protein